MLQEEVNEHMAALKGERGVWCLFSYSWWKGIFDRLVALVGIAVLSPLLVAIAAVVRLDSPGSSIFAQERVGKDGRRFTAYKFRTMYKDNDDGEYRTYLRQYILKNAAYRVDERGQEIYKVVDDNGVTRAGALLRKSNLDELPQLFNILRGEMSLIGPRPDVPFAVKMYNDWHRKRLSAKPGITGLWQVCGRKNLPFNDMVRLDIDYIEKQSPLLDVRILLLTARTILMGDGS